MPAAEDRAPLRLEPTPGGGFTIAAPDLAALLDLPVEAVRAEMRSGRITSLVERGEDADAGRFRVTFAHGPRRVRLVVDRDGGLLQRTRVTASPRPGRAP